jgi:hypothetical protein
MTPTTPPKAPGPGAVKATFTALDAVKVAFTALARGPAR